jgi:hypothetical protein
MKFISKIVSIFSTFFNLIHEFLNHNVHTDINNLIKILKLYISNKVKVYLMKW